MTSEENKRTLDDHAIIEAGRRVISIEARSLGLLEESLSKAFSDSVRLIIRSKGRVIVSGMGKSGHVGRKISATFASTGTPAQFVHPAEASHGDLGMVTPADIVLILSNSGETPELSDIIAHTRRFDIPMIGVASRADSTLLRQSDIAIELPKAQEACGTGIVPTSSTTMTLALGDALAVALMEQRRFTPDDFRVYHPGGKLGARLAKVSNLMHYDMPLVSVDKKMTEVLLIISGMGFGTAGVIDANGYLIGIITDGDLRRHMDGLLSMSAGEVMTKKPRTIPETSIIEVAVKMMNESKITSLFATDSEGRPCGLIHIHDCLRLS